MFDIWLMCLKEGKYIGFNFYLVIHTLLKFFCKEIFIY